MCCRLADCCRSVVAAGAVGRDACVVEGGAREGRGASVTRLARLRRRDMSRGLADGSCSVVAAGAVRGDACVVEGDPREGHGTLVTRLTRCLRRNMGCWLSLSQRSIMTARTRSDAFAVIVTGLIPRRLRMT